jgi:hypothetical protein
MPGERKSASRARPQDEAGRWILCSDQHIDWVCFMLDESMQGKLIFSIDTFF